MQLAARMRLISAISFSGGLSLFWWAFFGWKRAGFVTGPETTTEGAVGGFFVLLLGIGLGLMVLGISLFIRRDRPASRKASDPERRRRDSPARPLERVWHYGNIGYIAGVFLAVVVVWMVGMDARRWRHLEQVIGIAVALPFVSLGLLGLYAGKMSDEGDRYTRAKNPVIYWMLIALSLSVGTGATVFSIIAFGP